MTDYGLVSIITPSYNCSRFIGKTIDSIIAQTYTNWELIITDDNSSDESCEIIKRYVAADPRIKLLTLSTNSGAGVARNNSIAHATGRYIAFCDSDDRWMPHKLETQLKFMTEKDCALCYSSYEVYDEDDNHKGKVVCRKEIRFINILMDNGIGCLTAIYDAQKLGKVFMPTLRKRQDWGLWINIVKMCGVAYGIQESLALYRYRAGSISSNKMNLVKYNLNVYRSVLGYSKLKSWTIFILLFMPTYILKKIKFHF